MDAATLIRILHALSQRHVRIRGRDIFDVGDHLIEIAVDDGALSEAAVEAVAGWLREAGFPDGFVRAAVGEDGERRQRWLLSVLAAERPPVSVERASKLYRATADRDGYIEVDGISLRSVDAIAKEIAEKTGEGWRSLGKRIREAARRREPPFDRVASRMIREPGKRKRSLYIEAGAFDAIQSMLEGGGA